jgi:hypothetical protein
MDISTLSIDVDSLAKAIGAAESSSELNCCEDYAIEFGRLRDTQPELDDALHFLAVICSWRLRPDDPQMPFDFIWQAGTLNEISEEQLAVVDEVIPRISNPEIQARLSDLLWIRQRNHLRARIAAEAYVKCAERLILKQYVLGERERLARAIQIAAQLGRNGDLYGELLRQIVAIAERPELLNCTLASCLEVLSESRSGTDRLYEMAVQRARHLSQNGPNPLWERNFWGLAARFARYNKKDELARAAMIEVARTFEVEARQAPMQAVAASFWEMAVQVYRGVPGTEEERNRVHRELLNAQEHIPKEMIPLEIEPLDIHELVNLARGRLEGMDKMRALAELVFATRWHTVAYLREQAEQTIRRYPLQHMLSTVRFGSTWKVAGTAPSAPPGPGDIAEERLVAEMCQQYKYFIPIVANGTIGPMRDELMLSHNVTLEDIIALVEYSPLVPVGRGAFFAIGIHAGLHGRLIESLHVLIPQLEHMLRCGLALHNVVTSTLNNAGIQEEFDLNKLLSMPETASLLGEDLCFALRVLLVERHGYNLRNEMAHGMLSPGRFYSDDAIYTWWLVFRMIGGPVAEAIMRGSVSSDDEA